MKKNIALILTFFLLAAFTSCGGNRHQPVEPWTEADAEPTTESAEETLPPDETDYKALTVSAFSGLEDAGVEELRYTVSGETVTVTGYTGAGSRLKLPATLDGKIVTAVAEEAFAGNTELTAVWIPDSVTAVGAGILRGCTKLYALRTPVLGNGTAETAYLGYLFGAKNHADNAKDIPAALEFLTLGEGMTALPDFALYDCNDIVSILLPSGLRSVGAYALYRCERLKYVNTEGLETVGAHAFDSCSSLTEVSFGAGLTAAGIGALEGCGALRILTVPFVGGSATENTYLGYLFGATTPDFSGGYIPASLRSVTVLAGCTVIGDNAFSGGGSLRAVTLPAGVTSVGIRAFRNCTNLRRIDLPDSVLSVGAEAFYGCTRLAAVTVGNGLTSVGINCFYRCTALTEVILPESLSALPASCFADCTALRTVALGGVREVGKNAFRGCSALTGVTASGAVTFAEGNEKASAFFTY